MEGVNPSLQSESTGTVTNAVNYVKGLKATGIVVLIVVIILLIWLGVSVLNEWIATKWDLPTWWMKTNFLGYQEDKGYFYF